MSNRDYSDHDPRHLMDLHEGDAYMGTGLGLWEDPDGGLLRYSAVIRRVMELADQWMAEGRPDAHVLARAVKATLVNPDSLPLVRLAPTDPDPMADEVGKSKRGQR